MGGGGGGGGNLGCLQMKWRPGYACTLCLFISTVAMEDIGGGWAVTDFNCFNCLCKSVSDSSRKRSLGRKWIMGGNIP